MSRSADVVKFREVFEGAYGRLPSEVTPRVVIIGDLPAGRPGLNVTPPGSSMSIGDFMREYSDGGADYVTDWAQVYASRRVGNSSPGGFDVYRIAAADAVVAESEVITDDAAADPVDLFHFEAVGPGVAYNDLSIIVEVTRVIADHPAGANTSVCRVTIQGPNPYSSPEVFSDIVFTSEGSIDGTSGFDRTYDASVINNPVSGSRYVRLVYEATAGDSNFGVNHAIGDTVVVTLTGGTDGAALVDADYEAAIDAVSGLPWRWFVLPAPPSDEVRAYQHSTFKGSPFAMTFLEQMYGEAISDYITALAVYGRGADDGRSMAFYGWGAHPMARGREVPFSAGYLGEWSAKIAASGLGGAYAVGNSTLGYSNIATGDQLSRTDKEIASAAGVNFATQLYDGSFGVHGYWTRDDQVDRMGDGSVRVIVNDIARRMAIAFQPLAQNRPNNATTRGKIDSLGAQVIRPYVNTGAISRASTGTFDLMEVRSRWQGIGFPDLPGWAVFMASLRVNLTLAGIFVHLSDQEIEGLVSIMGGAATAAAPAGEAAPAAAAGGSA